MSFWRVESGRPNLHSATFTRRYTQAVCNTTMTSIVCSAQETNLGRSLWIEGLPDVVGEPVLSVSHGGEIRFSGVM